MSTLTNHERGMQIARELLAWLKEIGWQTRGFYNPSDTAETLEEAARDLGDFDVRLYRKVSEGHELWSWVHFMPDLGDDAIANNGMTVNDDVDAFMASKGLIE